MADTAADSGLGFELARLDRDDCLRLLAGSSLGRLAVNMPGAAPVIRPVNYVFDEPSLSVAFRCASGSKLHALGRSDRAAFEVDGEDPHGASGWSVIVVGAVEAVTSAGDLARLARAPLRSWLEGTHAPRWMRIRATAISGRRIGSRGPVGPRSA